MNLSLRPWRESDFDRLSLLGNNPKIFQFLSDSFPSPCLPEDAKRYYEAHAKNDEGDIIRAICIDDGLVGSIGLHAKTDIHRHEMEIGYWIGEPYWGQGLASWAVPQMLPLGFQRDGIIRIYAEVMAHNPGSQRVLEKSGFELEGRFKYGLIKGGKYCDSIRYGIVKLE